MTTRALPAHMYRYPDPGDTRIPDLEKALLDANDSAARTAGTAARLLFEIFHAHNIGIELPLNVEFALREWIEAGKPGLAP